MQRLSLQNQHFASKHCCAGEKSVSEKLKGKNLKDNKNFFIILKKMHLISYSYVIFYRILLQMMIFMPYILHTVFFNIATVNSQFLRTNVPLKSG